MFSLEEGMKDMSFHGMRYGRYKEFIKYIKFNGRNLDEVKLSE
jgi:hypothetical protein